MGGAGKKKIEIKKILKSERRFVTFCKRKKGLFKKVAELATMTGSRLVALVFSPAAQTPHTCGDMKLIDQYLFDTCPEPESIGVDAALRIHASRNLEEVHDLNELTAMRSELRIIRDTLLQRLT